MTEASRCTRDDELNIDEFMRHDLSAINAEEEKLQREIMNLQRQNIHKHHKVIKHNHIDTKIQNTE